MTIPFAIPSGPNPPVVHPGPVMEARRCVAPTRAARFDIAIQAGAEVQAAILNAFEAKGLASGTVVMDGLACDPLRFVMPAASPTPDRFAWYSDTYAPAGPATILRGHMSVGRHDGEGFTHCHGLWRLGDGTLGIGHLLARECRAAAPVTLPAIGFRDALFERRPDPETRFDLFAAVGAREVAGPPDAIALTLRPNEAIMTAVRDVCKAHGIAAAEMRGLGSLNGAVFRDGGRMRSAITEFLILDGRIDGEDTRLDIAAIDQGGNQFVGAVDPAEARVSVTAELLIVPRQG